MELILLITGGLGVIASTAFLALIFLVGRWAHRTHGIVCGYWIFAWILWGRAIGLIVPFATKAIIDGLLVGQQSGWTIGQVMTLNNYANFVIGVLAQLVLAILVSSELLCILAPREHPLLRVLAYVRDIQPHRHRLGVLALILSSVKPLMWLLGWLVLAYGR